MKPWERDVPPEDDQDIYLDALIAGGIVLVSAIICATALFLVLGYFWPSIMAAFEAVRFVP